MTVTIPKLRWSRSGSSTESGSAASGATERPRRRRINTAWTAPAMVLVLCLVATGWVFARGAAAEAWLVAVIAVAVAGIPVMLILLRLFGYEDGD
jgi:hypothetical protein